MSKQDDRRRRKDSRRPIPASPISNAPSSIPGMTASGNSSERSCLMAHCGLLLLTLIVGIGSGCGSPSSNPPQPAGKVADKHEVSVTTMSKESELGRDTADPDIAAETTATTDHHEEVKVLRRTIQQGSDYERVKAAIRLLKLEPSAHSEVVRTFASALRSPDDTVVLGALTELAKLKSQSSAALPGLRVLAESLRENDAMHPQARDSLLFITEDAIRRIEGR